MPTLHPLISIIVPVYNAEKYIGNCIDSILKQINVGFECILVDDGSKDASGKICDEYAEKDSRIKCIHHVNGGEIAARATGIRQTKGEFLYFVDADDAILPDTLCSMLPFMKEDVDIVIFESDKNCIYSKDEYVQALLGFQHWVVWGKLYRRTLFDEYVMDVSRYFKVGGDFLTSLKTTKNIKGSIVCKPEKKYLYNTTNTQSVQVGHQRDYEYEKRMVYEVDGILQNIKVSKEAEHALFKWKMIYLGGMIGLRYKINYEDDWIVSLLKEAKQWPLALKERITISAAHNPLARLVLISEKVLKSYVRRLIR